MKKDCDMAFAKIFINALGDRMHIPSQKEIEQYINKDEGQFNGRKNWYCIRLDNLASWGFAEAYVIWKKIEKECQKYDNCEIYHAQERGVSNYIYTWGKKKKITVDNTTVELNTRMLYPRHPKECGNDVYITTNDKGFYWLIINELKSRKLKKINDDHTVTIDNKNYRTENLAKIISKNPKNMVNLIEDMITPLKADDRYHDSLKKMTNILLKKYLETSYISDLEESIIKSAYITTGNNPII